MQGGNRREGGTGRNCWGGGRGTGLEGRDLDEDKPRVGVTVRVWCDGGGGAGSAGSRGISGRRGCRRREVGDPRVSGDADGAGGGAGSRARARSGGAGARRAGSASGGAGRADARGGEGAGQEGEGERARNAEAAAAAAAAVAAAATAAAAALQLAPRSGLRRRAGREPLPSSQAPGRTTPATRAPWRHRAHPGPAQAPKA